MPVASPVSIKTIRRVRIPLPPPPRRGRIFSAKVAERFKPNSGGDFSFELRTPSRQGALVILRKAHLSPKLGTPRIWYGSRNSNVSKRLSMPTKRGSAAPLGQARASDFQFAISRFESSGPSQPVRRSENTSLIPAERPANGRFPSMRHRSPGSSFQDFRSQIADSLRRIFEKLPFFGDGGRRPGSICTVWRPNNCIRGWGSSGCCRNGAGLPHKFRTSFYHFGTAKGFPLHASGPNRSVSVSRKWGATNSTGSRATS